MSRLDNFAEGVLFATLSETRRRLRTWWGFVLVVGIASVYTLISMLLGQMLILRSIPSVAGYGVEVVNRQGTQWWNYPGLLVTQPWGILALPFFPTVAMVLVSIGVGLGGATGILLILPFLRRRHPVELRSTATGTTAGIGPAITGLATLGACCCTSCAGVAGVAVVAAASGSNLNNLLLNNWYIGVFEIGVVYVALLAQERLLRKPADACPVPLRMDRRFAAGVLLRLGLMVAGITWSLAMFIEWGDTSPLSASGATGFHWVMEHQLLSITAVSAGLFPNEFANAVRRLASNISGGVLRVGLGLAGVTWGIGVPPVLVSLGLGGLLNETMGFWGLPSWVGAIPPDSALGIPLYFHWVFQHALLGAFALALAIQPQRAVLPLLWTVEGGDFIATANSQGPSARPSWNPRGAPIPAARPTESTRTPTIEVTPAGDPGPRPLVPG